MKSRGMARTPNSGLQTLQLSCWEGWGQGVSRWHCVLHLGVLLQDLGSTGADVSPLWRWENGAVRCYCDFRSVLSDKFKAHYV